MNLEQFFKENNRVALAFSGGVDSAYLLYAAIKYGVEIKAYYVKTAFQPQFELDDALRLAEELNADMKVIEADILVNNEISANPKDRCYHCKKVIFGLILKAAIEDGFSVVLDGTNASDDEGDRPGMKALRELEVKSPLRTCGLTKSRIRELSHEAGLFTWDKPAYACLATRISSGEVITKEKLEATEQSEQYLTSLGFKDFRVRRVGDVAKLQIKEVQLPLAIDKRQEIFDCLKRYYSEVLLDLEVRR